MGIPIIIFIFFIVIIIKNRHDLQIKSLIKHHDLYKNQIDIHNLDLNIISHLEFDKKQAITPILMYSLKRDYWDTTGNTSTIFTKNLSDRGKDNRDKRFYMNATTSDKFKYYDKWINLYIEKIQSGIDGNRWIISEIKKHTIYFFIAIHYSIDSYNEQYQFLYSYYEKIIDMSSSDESLKDTISVIIKTSQLRNCYDRVYNFTQKRVIEIIDNNLNDNMVYYWYNNGNGFSIEQIVSACLHNIVAFSQFIIISNDIIGDHFDEYIKLYKRSPYHAIREIYRLNTPSGKVYSQRNGIQVCHHLQNIMKGNDNDYGKMKEIGHYGEYTQSGDTELVMSEIDDETLIEKGNQGNIPVYEKPTYCPFGLGYRRCAGENLSYYITNKLLGLFQKYNLKIDTSRDKKIKLGLFHIERDNKLLIYK